MSGRGWDRTPSHDRGRSDRCRLSGAARTAAAAASAASGAGLARVAWPVRSPAVARLEERSQRPAKGSVAASSRAVRVVCDRRVRPDGRHGDDRRAGRRDVAVARRARDTAQSSGNRDGAARCGTACPRHPATAPRLIGVRAARRVERRGRRDSHRGAGAARARASARSCRLARRCADVRRAVRRRRESAGRRGVERRGANRSHQVR